MTCLSFLFRNLVFFRSCPRFEKRVEGKVILEGASWGDISAIRRIYKFWNGGKDFGFCRTVLVGLIGRKICLVAKRNGVTVGYDLFYVNMRDIYDKTVHEGFVGLLKSEVSKGLGSSLRNFAGEHFRRCGIFGISSKINQENSASLRSAEKVGFKIVDNQPDILDGKKQFYLVWWLVAQE